MGTFPASDCFDIGYDIFGSLEIEPSVCTELLDKSFLISTGVDGDNATAHVFGVLNRKMAKTSTSSWKNYPITSTSIAIF